jgi:hypothetical protein
MRSISKLLTVRPVFARLRFVTRIEATHSVNGNWSTVQDENYIQIGLPGIDLLVKLEQDDVRRNNIYRSYIGHFLRCIRDYVGPMALCQFSAE